VWSPGEGGLRPRVVAMEAAEEEEVEEEEEEVKGKRGRSKGGGR